MTSGARGALLALSLLAGCMPAGAGAPGADPGPAGGGDPAVMPAGFGTLRQPEVTVALRQDDLEVRVTPLADWVLPLLVPDTHRRLSAMVERLDPSLASGRVPVLVSLFTESAGGAAFQAGDLTLVNRGRTFRPLAIQGLTSGWDRGRLEQSRPAQALYLFDGSVDLEMELTVEFGDARSSAWSAVIPRLQAELARVRSRVGSGITPPARTS